MVTGFWYEVSLAAPWTFGLDYKNRKCTFYDDGETKINVIVSSILALQLEAETTLT